MMLKKLSGGKCLREVKPWQTTKESNALHYEKMSSPKRRPERLSDSSWRLTSILENRELENRRLGARGWFLKTPLTFFHKIDRIVRAGGNAQAIEITPLMVDNGSAINQMQRTVRTNLDTLTGTTAFFQIDQNSHWDPLNIYMTQSRKSK